jgi:hypothetical protein
MKGDAEEEKQRQENKNDEKDQIRVGNSMFKVSDFLVHVTCAILHPNTFKLVDA